MLDFSQFKQLKRLDGLKSHQTTKFIVIPEDLKAKISYKTLLSEVTWSDLGEFVNVMHVFKDGSAWFSYLDELSLINMQETYHALMIAYDEDDREEFIATFENAKALEDYLASRLHFPSDAVYLELDDQMIEELAAKTRETQIKFYDEKIAEAKRDMKRAAATVEEFEDLKGELMNERN